MAVSRNWNHAKAVSAKFGLIGLLLAATLPWAGFGPGRYVVVAAAILAVSLYLTGDLFAYPYLGNLIASIGDGMMATAMLYGMQFLLPGARLSLPWALTAGIMVGAAEFFYHQLLKRLDVVARETPQVMPKAWERSLGNWLAGGHHSPETNERQVPNPLR